MAHLEVLEGFHCGESFPLPDDAGVGRHPESFLCLPEHHVSRHHARLQRRGNTFVIEDLQSSNGVIVQGKRLPPQVPYALQDGDEILICSTRMVFRADTLLPTSPQLPRALSPALIAPEPMTKRIVLTGEGEALRLRMLRDDAAQPGVALTLDASMNWLEVSDTEKHTNQGLQEALKRLQAMCQVSTALGAITDRETLLSKILACLFDIFPVAERAFIMLRDKDSGQLVPVVARMRQGTAEPLEEVAISQSIVNEVVLHKRSILSRDALEDSRFNQNMSVVDLSIRSMMCTPLLINGEILGLMQVDTCTTPRGFTVEDLQVLTGISAQAAIAVKNLQLYEAIEAETARRISLQRYFSPGLVDMLMSGEVTATLGGDAYQGTILLADIIGFTAMSEKMPPARVVAKLNRYFTIMQKVIYAHGGNVDKFNGDGLMAFWGVPRAGAYNESDAVLTAIRMQQKLWLFNLQLCAEGRQPVHMGIGLNSGEFIAGNIGSEDKIEFTLIGDTVNLTARIEHLAGRYQVLVSEATWFPIKDLVCAVRLPPMMVKGKSHPVTLYSIRAIHDRHQGGYALALPCRVLDAQGNRMGHGILTGSSPGDPGHGLVFNTGLPLASGATLTLQWVMPEYDEPLQLTTLVTSCTTMRHEGACSYSQALLAVTDDAAAAFLTPGSCLAATQTWRPTRA
jgi:adenylate cyclase